VGSTIVGLLVVCVLGRLVRRRMHQQRAAAAADTAAVVDAAAAVADADPPRAETPSSDHVLRVVSIHMGALHNIHEDKEHECGGGAGCAPVPSILASTGPASVAGSSMASPSAADGAALV
jgi:hypothetical protein